MFSATALRSVLAASAALPHRATAACGAVRTFRIKLPNQISKLPLKSLQVRRLKEDIAKSAGFLVIQAPDWADPDWAPLKAQIDELGVRTRMVKNTLMRVALESSPFRALMPVFVGPNSVLFFPSVEAGVKLVAVLSKQPQCVVFAGTLGHTILDAEDIKALGKAPPRESVLAELVALMQAAPASLAAALSSPAYAVARSVHQLSQRDEKDTKTPA